MPSWRWWPAGIYSPEIRQSANDPIADFRFNRVCSRKNNRAGLASILLSREDFFQMDVVKKKVSNKVIRGIGVAALSGMIVTHVAPDISLGGPVFFLCAVTLGAVLAHIK